MRAHLLEREQHVASPPDQAFALYSDAFRLEDITPPWLAFRVVTAPPIRMGPGTLIDYRLRVRGVPLRWRTRIEVWELGRRFVDRQVAGPYRFWLHSHEFDPGPGGGTIIRDRVRYALPLGPVGALAHLVIVRRDLRRIFDFRRDAVERLLATGAS